MDKGKLFIVKEHGWQDIFVKNNSLINKDTFDKTIAGILMDEPGCNSILLPPITKAERYKIHRFQRKNKLLAETIYVNDTSELRNMLISVPTTHLKEFLSIHAEKSVKEKDQKLDEILNDFRNKIKELIK